MTDQQQFKPGDTVYHGISDMPAGVVVAVSRSGRTVYVRHPRYGLMHYAAGKLHRRDEFVAAEQ